MNALAFVLECAAVAAIIGTGASLVVWPLLAAVSRASSLAAAARAELDVADGGEPGKERWVPCSSGWSPSH